MTTSRNFQIVPFEKLKNTKAWKNTSLLVRLCSNGICYTCNQKFAFDKIVAGHFREKRGGSATYFDLDNLRAQCSWNCNRMRHGAKEIYAIKLIDEIGRDRVDALFVKGSKAKQWTKDELDKIAEERQQLIDKYNANLKF